jgi:hypothetical protein
MYQVEFFEEVFIASDNEKQQTTGPVSKSTLEVLLHSAPRECAFG